MGFGKLLKKEQKPERSDGFVPSTKEDLKRYAKRGKKHQLEKHAEKESRKSKGKKMLRGETRAMQYRELLAQHARFDIFKTNVIDAFVAICKTNGMEVPRYKAYLPRKEADAAFVYAVNICLSKMSWIQLSRLISEAVNAPIVTKEFTEAFNFAAHVMLNLVLNVKSDETYRMANLDVLDDWPAKVQKRPKKEDRMGKKNVGKKKKHEEEDEDVKENEDEEEEEESSSDEDEEESEDDDEGDDDDEDEAPRKKSSKGAVKKKKPAKDEDEDEDEDEESDDEESEDEESEDEDEESEDEESDDEESEDEESEDEEEESDDEESEDEESEDEESDDEEEESEDEESDDDEDDEPKKPHKRKEKTTVAKKSKKPDAPVKTKKTAAKASKKPAAKQEHSADPTYRVVKKFKGGVREKAQSLISKSGTKLSALVKSARKEGIPEKKLLSYLSWLTANGFLKKE